MTDNPSYLGNYVTADRTRAEVRAVDPDLADLEAGVQRIWPADDTDPISFPRPEIPRLTDAEATELSDLPALSMDLGASLWRREFHGSGDTK